MWISRSLDDESSSSGHVSIGDTNDELLTVTKESNKEVMASSSGKSSTSNWILDSKCCYHIFFK